MNKTYKVIDEFSVNVNGLHVIVLDRDIECFPRFVRANGKKIECDINSVKSWIVVKNEEIKIGDTVELITSHDLLNENSNMTRL